MAGTAYGVAIGMEDYAIAKMNPTRFARADAQAFADVLTGHLGVPAANVTVWLDAAVNASNLSIELPAIIDGLGAEDRFYFFYAGHGFWTSGSSRLTVYDTHPDNLFGSTVELERALLKPLRTSPCRSSLVFIDACAQELFDPTVASRDIVSPMSEAEFRKFIKDTEHAAAYFACSRKEKSHSTAALGHGIWTHHLLRALRGEEPKAARKGLVTGHSLLDYLKAEVPRFITRETTIKARQTPYGLLGAPGDFPIRDMPVATPAPAGLTAIVPNFAAAFFRSIETKGFAALPGFSKAKKHTVPDRDSDSANGWAQRLLNEEVQEELQTVNDNAKRILELGRRDVSLNAGVGEGSVDTELFRYEIVTGQLQGDPGKAYVQREIVLRVPPSDLGEDFDDIFPEAVDRIVVPFSGGKEFYEDLADSLEAIERAGGGSFQEDVRMKVLTLTLADRSALIFDTNRKTMTIRPPSPAGCLDVVAKLGQGSFAKLLGGAPLMIGTSTAE
jgi:hypothetical protein